MKIFICGTVDKNLKSKYYEGVDKIAQNLASNGDGIMCVGSSTGSIGEMYNNMTKLGGKVDLIVPTPYAEESIGMQANSFIAVDTLYMLQQIALRNTKATIVLPGGNGTLAELYMITDSIKSNFDTDLVVVYNINGFYDKLKEMNEFMLEAGALTERQAKFFTWCNSAEEVISVLDKWREKNKNTTF